MGWEWWSRRDQNWVWTLPTKQSNGSGYGDCWENDYISVDEMNSWANCWWTTASRQRSVSSSWWYDAQILLRFFNSLTQFYSCRRFSVSSLSWCNARIGQQRQIYCGHADLLFKFASLRLFSFFLLPSNYDDTNCKGKRVGAKRKK